MPRFFTRISRIISELTTETIVHAGKFGYNLEFTWNFQYRITGNN